MTPLNAGLQSQLPLYSFIVLLLFQMIFLDLIKCKVSDIQAWNGSPTGVFYHVWYAFMYKRAKKEWEVQTHMYNFLQETQSPWERIWTKCLFEYQRWLIQKWHDEAREHSCPSLSSWIADDIDMKAWWMKAVVLSCLCPKDFIWVHISRATHQVHFYIFWALVHCFFAYILNCLNL